ncbi:uncharacterized protein LOC108108123 [Drosophila eugracilis]|uniref:uncharacterized protein LOC108108123 n=1 Tax=Drosophila eugracilis TaxID=29029 RepID=UPI0007E67A68|nr:uncharacterized protein LOC108108123 [Drosophila eugracilis]XP_017071529.1 uncharacterized protein LOC108108123 [Drosophila eugracilis]XP_017071531.1 uncharacterized protein LOC108108123 [Drosophila eugracilis]XP_017071532.1 uncharacterized protein LOC108108123 [Drosophila eugracilis]XP_017071533.1 uncharacterized protein LOC108108123 [Drosophila eugracilis]
MEQQENDSIKALEAEAKRLDTELALQKAGIENNRLKLEVTRFESILKKQKEVLQNAEDNRKEAELVFSTILGFYEDTESNLSESSNPTQSEEQDEEPSEDT